MILLLQTVINEQISRDFTHGSLKERLMIRANGSFKMPLNITEL
jgi:hypothetical protein